MGKKEKGIAGLTESQLALSVKDSAQQIWLAGLGAFSKAQEEGNKVFDKLVREGEALHSKTKKLTDEKVSSWSNKAAGTWDRLEHVFEERVVRSLSHLGVPSKQDIVALNRRIDELSLAVKQLSAGRSAAKASTKAPVGSKVPPKTVRKAPVKKAPAKPAVRKAAPKKVAAKPVAKAPLKRKL